MRSWIGLVIPPLQGEGGPPSVARRVGWGPPTPARFARRPSPASALPYLHISRFRVADSGETLDFGSFPALGDAQGAVWCKSLFRLIFRKLCRYRSASAGEGADRVCGLY